MNKRITKSFAIKKSVSALFSSLVLATLVAGCQVTPQAQQGSQSVARTTPLYENKPMDVVTDQKLCDDFLARLGQKTPELEFVGCSAGFYEDHHTVIANYNVAGTSALVAQEHLHKISGMPRMVKDCCVWDSIDQSEGKIGGVINDGSERYYVRMQSDELRLGWNIASDVDRISNFRVQVIYPLNQYGFESNRFAGSQR